VGNIKIYFSDICHDLLAVLSIWVTTKEL